MCKSELIKKKMNDAAIKDAWFVEDRFVTN